VSSAKTVVRNNAAIVDEISGLMSMDVVVPVLFSTVTTDDSVIPAHMLVNDKYTPQGIYDKTKARFCAGGNYSNQEILSILLRPPLMILRR